MKPLKAARAAKPQPWLSTPLATGRLKANIGFQIRFCVIALFRDYVAAAGPGALTPSQVNVLELVRVNPGAPQVAVAAALATDKATMMALVDRLEQAGLLTRHKSDVDRRRQTLQLTPAGQAALKSAYAIMQAQQARRLKRLSRKEADQLLLLLQRLAEPME